MNNPESPAALRAEIEKIQKREVKAQRSLLATLRRVERLESFVQKLADAIKTGLPHMPHGELTWLENEEDPHG